jgi:hypothetical protein
MVEMGKQMNAELVNVQGILMSLDEFRVLELNYQGLNSDEIATEMRKLSRRKHWTANDVDKIFCCPDKPGTLLHRIGCRSRRDAIRFIAVSKASVITIGLQRIEELFKLMFRVRVEENAPLALELIQVLLGLIDDAIVKNTDASIRERLYKLRLNVLLEEERTYQLIYGPNQLLKTTKPLTERIIKQAQVLHDPALEGLAYFIKGQAYYMASRFHKSRCRTAITALKKAKENISDLEDVLLCHRHEALCWAYLGDKEEFGKLAKQGEVLISQGKEAHSLMTISLVEGLGRGWGLLGDEAKALHMLHDEYSKVTKSYAISGSAGVFPIQIMRSRVDVAIHLGNQDRRYIEEQGKEVIRLSKERYPKYTLEINALLNS